MHRAVILEADFRSVVQGDLSIDAYCTKLKKLSDKLRDVGHPVSEPSQVLNLLRGLNPKYRYVKPVLTSKPHTFMSARSYLLLEEIQLQHDDNTAAGQAFLANHGGSTGSAAPAAHGGSFGSGGSSSGASGSSNPDAGGNRGSKPKNKRRGRAPSAGSSSSGNTSVAPQRPQVPWTANYNPWTGLVQAWPMPFRAPGSGLLGPRPPAQQAMVAQHPAPPTPNAAHYGASAWDNSALYAALNTAGVATQPPSSADWYFDTGASSHMSSGSGISPSSLTPFHSFVTVGNGARLPVTHTAAGTIPTSSTPLHLHNVLVTPSLVKNLVSVRQLTRDNNISIEFDPAGFSIKDIPTQTVTLRCDSPGDLYPLRLPLHQALSASSSASIELWHNRLGHPGTTTLHQVLHTLDFHCNKSAAHSCHHCSVGKHTRLPFQHSDTPAYFPFQLVHSDVWTSPVYSHSGYKYYVVFIDAYTHYIWSYPVRQKSDVPHVIRAFFAYVTTQFRLPIVAFRSDNGTEYDNVALRSFFSAQGTAFRLSCPYTSQQNGKAERICTPLTTVYVLCFFTVQLPSPFGLKL